MKQLTNVIPYVWSWIIALRYLNKRGFILRNIQTECQKCFLKNIKHIRMGMVNIVLISGYQNNTSNNVFLIILK